jgi:hypothetical protein
MTSLIIWAPSRYRLEQFGQLIQDHSVLGRQNIVSIQIRHHEYLKERLINSFSNEVIHRRHSSNIHVLLIDDWDLEFGLDLEQISTFVRNLINLSQVFPNSSIVICDLIDYLFADGRFTFAEIRQFKSRLNQLIQEGDINNVYVNHAGDIDGSVCNDNNLPNEEGLRQLSGLIIEDITNLPLNRF